MGKMCTLPSFQSLSILAAGALAAGLALVQTRDTGAIFGTVSDVQGAVITNAALHLTSANTGQVRSTKTNDSGDYLFSLLPVGTYSITVEQTGFRRYERTGVLVQANENVKVAALRCSLWHRRSKPG
jgi:hypothetical protein